MSTQAPFNSESRVQYSQRNITGISVEKKQNNEAIASKKKELAEKLSVSIFYHMQENYEQALEEGADINFADEDVGPALYAAISANNVWARKDLLQNRGADPRGLSKKNQRVPIQIAAAIGDLEAFEELVDVYNVDPKTFREMNLLHSAIEEISSFSLLQNAKFSFDGNAVGKARNDMKLKKEVEHFFLQTGEYEQIDDEAVPFKHGDPIHVFYSGQEDMIASLLSRGVSPILPATGTSRAPQLVAQNPTKFIYAFRANDESELKYIGDEGQNVLTFKMKFQNNTREAGFDIILHYDFKPIERLIQSHLSTLTVQHVKDQAYSEARRFSDEFRQFRADQALDSRRLLDVEQKQRHDAKALSEHDRVLNQKLGLAVEKRIADLCKRPGMERFFDIFSRTLRIKLDAYRQISSGCIPRMKDTKGDYAVSILEFVAGHIPAPFNTPFTAFQKLTAHQVDKREQKRYEKIASLLPNDKDLSVYCRELACEIADGLVKYINQLSPGTIDKLATGDAKQMLEMEELAKRAFVVAMYTIYNVDDLKIDEKLSAEERSQALTSKVLKAVSDSEFFRTLVETKTKTASAKISPPSTPTIAAKPPVPPRPVQPAFDLMRSAEEAKKIAEAEKNKGALAKGVAALKAGAKNAYMQAAFS